MAISLLFLASIVVALDDHSLRGSNKGQSFDPCLFCESTEYTFEPCANIIVYDSAFPVCFCPKLDANFWSVLDSCVHDCSKYNGPGAKQFKSLESSYCRDYEKTHSSTSSSPLTSIADSAAPTTTSSSEATSLATNNELANSVANSQTISSGTNSETNASANGANVYKFGYSVGILAIWLL